MTQFRRKYFMTLFGRIESSVFCPTFSSSSFYDNFMVTVNIFVKATLHCIGRISTGLWTSDRTKCFYSSNKQIHIKGACEYQFSRSNSFVQVGGVVRNLRTRKNSNKQWTNTTNIWKLSLLNIFSTRIEQIPPYCHNFGFPALIGFGPTPVQNMLESVSIKRSWYT